MSGVLQYAVVIAAIAIAVAFMLRRFVLRRGGDCGCGSCPLVRESKEKGR